MKKRPQKAKKGVRKRKGLPRGPSGEHKHAFDQLLDDAIFGAAQKRK